MVTNQPIPAKGGSLIGATTVVWEDVYKGTNVMWRVPRNIRWNDSAEAFEDGRPYSGVSLNSFCRKAGSFNSATRSARGKLATAL